MIYRNFSQGVKPTILFIFNACMHARKFWRRKYMFWTRSASKYWFKYFVLASCKILYICAILPNVIHWSISFHNFCWVIFFIGFCSCRVADMRRLYLYLWVRKHLVWQPMASSSVLKVIMWTMQRYIASCLMKFS